MIRSLCSRDAPDTWPRPRVRRGARVGARLVGLRRSMAQRRDRCPWLWQAEPDGRLRNPSWTADPRRVASATAYHPGMHLDARGFLDEERDAWRPFEALADLPDERLAAPVGAAHGW